LYRSGIFRARNGNFRKSPFFGSLSAKRPISFVCFLVGCQASPPNLGCRVSGRKAGPSNMRRLFA
jgi:hypothetical protein